MAFKDITCYKIMIDKGNGFLCTPYQNAYLNENRELIGRGSKIVREDAPGEFTVEEGYVHTFADFCDAKTFLSGFMTAPKKYIIFEAIIPKGTKYFEGSFLYCFNSFASSRVILKNELFIADQRDKIKVKFI